MRLQVLSVFLECPSRQFCQGSIHDHLCYMQAIAEKMKGISSTLTLTITRTGDLHLQVVLSMQKVAFCMHIVTWTVWHADRSCDPPPALLPANNNLTAVLGASGLS